MEARAGRQVRFVADDRVDAAIFASGVKLDGPVEVAVVGDRAGVHAEGFGLLHQFGDAVEAVEEAIVSVQVQMGEFIAVGHGRWHP